MTSQEEAQQQLAGFRSWSGGATARFAAAQAAIIRSLVSQVAELIGDEPGGGAASAGAGGPAGQGNQGADLSALLSLSDSTGPPDDPVLARLLPDAYTDDQEASAEFRRYTERDLRAGKVAAARTVLDTLPSSGGRVRLTGPQGRDWLRSLNDVRLALGVRLGVTDDFDEQVSDVSADDPRSAYIWVYQWLAYLQDSLVSALS